MGSSSLPGFADTTDYSRGQWRETALAKWREEEERNDEDAQRRRRRRRKDRRDRYEGSLPPIADERRAAVSPAPSDGARQEKAVSGSAGSAEHSRKYMLAGCVCTSYAATQTTASATAGQSKQAAAAATHTSSRPKQLPSVGAWRQTWLHRAPPIDRLNNGIQE